MNGVVKQLSIFVNNEMGALAATSRVLKECNVVFKAFCISESIGFGVLRAIVDDPEEKAKELRAKGLVVKLTDVIAIEMNTEKGRLYDEFAKVSDSGLNIEYAYAFVSETRPMFYIKVDNTEKAIQMMKERGILSE